jgi:hypothetical protein
VRLFYGTNERYDYQDLRMSYGILNHRGRREHRGIGVRENFCVSPDYVQHDINSPYQGEETGKSCSLSLPRRGLG